MSTHKCNLLAWARCPDHEICGWPACYADGSECVAYNRLILDQENSHEWISVKDRLPDVEKEVLILCNRNGYPVITTAMYEDGTNTTEYSEWWWNEASDFCKYDEENDLYIIPEGWWEYKHFNTDDAYNNAVDVPVTHWMPIPDLPKE